MPSRKLLPYNRVFLHYIESGTMTLALFDLDNTLICDDSDNLWGEFLVEEGLVDAAEYGAKNEKFYKDYKRGELDIYAYLQFVASGINSIEASKRESIRSKFMEEKIKKVMLPKAAALLDEHRGQGHTLMVITATSSYITRPIVKALGIELLLAPELEQKGDYFTGGVISTPTFQQGKVERLETWLAQNNESITGAFFYSDSHNDLPLLKVVDNPVAVDPDEKLKQYCDENNIPVISLR